MDDDSRVSAEAIVTRLCLAFEGLDVDEWRDYFDLATFMRRPALQADTPASRIS